MTETLEQRRARRQKRGPIGRVIEALAPSVPDSTGTTTDTAEAEPDEWYRQARSVAGFFPDRGHMSKYR